jgi:hypothetical protein
VFICPLKTVAAFQQQSTYFLSFNMASFTYWKQHLHTTEKDIKSCSCILCYIKILAVGSGNINCSTLKLSRRHLEDFSIRNLICKVSSPIDGWLFNSVKEDPWTAFLGLCKFKLHIYTWVAGYYF